MQGSLSRSLISELWLRRGMGKEEGKGEVEGERERAKKFRK